MYSRKSYRVRQWWVRLTYNLTFPEKGILWNFVFQRLAGYNAYIPQDNDKLKDIIKAINEDIEEMEQKAENRRLLRRERIKETNKNLKLKLQNEYNNQ